MREKPREEKSDEKKDWKCISYFVGDCDAAVSVNNGST